MFGTKSNTGAVNPIRVPDLSNGSLRPKLKAAGIVTNSAQYKAAVKEMTKRAGSSGMFINVQAIKNLMKQYDKDGDYMDPATRLAGLLVTEENAASRKRIIAIPENSQDEMFELTKKEFLEGNGMGNGDTTKRLDIYTALYRKTSKNDRLAAGHTLSQYERADWEIETKYGGLKTKMRLEDFSAKNPQAIRQDLYAALFISNLSALMKSSAEAEMQEKLTGGKHKCQLNRSYIIGITVRYVKSLLTILNYKKQLAAPITRIQRMRSIIRPDRRFKRISGHHGTTNGFYIRVNL